MGKRRFHPTLIAQILTISAAYTPPPEGFVSPVTWGVEENVRERFGNAGISDDRITCEPTTWVFRDEAPPADFRATFRDYYGPMMNAFEAARADGHEAELQAELTDLFNAQNKAGPDRTEIPATFLKVTVTK